MQPRLTGRLKRNLHMACMVSDSWLSGGCSQRQIIRQAAPSFGQPRLIGLIGRPFDMLRDGCGGGMSATSHQSSRAPWLDPLKSPLKRPSSSTCGLGLGLGPGDLGLGLGLG